MFIWKFIKGIFDFINTYFKTIILLLIIVIVVVSTKDDAESMQSPNLAKLHINVPIYESESVAQQIETIKKNKDIKGILLLIDSPGGSVGASIEIADMIKELSNTYPIVAYTQSVMASGSYYAGMYAHSLYANRGALIGSIGVIFSTPNIEELMQKVGVKMQGIKAGEYKEIGAITRAWSIQEKTFLEKLLHEQYVMFYQDVLAAREGKLTNTNPDEFANGKVFSAANAKNLGLIDEVGSMSDAINELKQLSGVDEAIWMQKDKFDVLVNKFIDGVATKMQLWLMPSFQTRL